MEYKLLQSTILARAGDDAYYTHRIPCLAATAKGTLLACWEARKGGAGDWGDIDILISRSTDGREWRRCLCLTDGRHAADGRLHTLNNPVLIVDDQQVLLIYHRNYKQAFLRVSGDDGLTWSAPRDITGAYRAFGYEWNICATGPGHGIHMDNGRLVAPIWLAVGEEKEDGSHVHWPSVAGSIYSDDGGESWHAGPLTYGLTDANETTVAQLPNGSLLYSIRNRDARKRRALAVSADGQTPFVSCALHAALTDPMCSGAMLALPGGAIAYVGNDHETARRNLTVRVTYDGGERWETLFPVSDMGGYADMSLVGDQLFIIHEWTNPETHRVDHLTLRKYGLQSGESERSG